MTQETLLYGTDRVCRLTLQFVSKKAEICDQVYMLCAMVQKILSPPLQFPSYCGRDMGIAYVSLSDVYRRRIGKKASYKGSGITQVYQHQKSSRDVQI
jgi:hypothetical protein